MGQEPGTATTDPGQEPGQQEPGNGQQEPPKAGEPATNANGQEPKTFDEAYVTKLREENAAARVKLKEYEDATKTKEQKEAEERDSLKGRAETAEQKLLKFEVAAAKDIPLKHAHRLQGSTKEELEQDATELAKELRAQDPPPDFKGGPRGSAATPTDMDALIRQAARGTRM